MTNTTTVAPHPLSSSRHLPSNKNNNYYMSRRSSSHKMSGSNNNNSSSGGGNPAWTATKQQPQALFRQVVKVIETPWRLALASSPKRRRKVIDKYLRRMGRKVNQELSLDSQGMCYIPFRKFLVIIDVPPNNRGGAEHEDDIGGQCNIYTMVYDKKRSAGPATNGSNHHPAKKPTGSSGGGAIDTTLELLNIQLQEQQEGPSGDEGILQRKGGTATLGLDGQDEVYLFYSIPIEGLRFQDMMNVMENFLATSVQINNTLASVGSNGGIGPASGIRTR